jgi:hypothetical protein
MRLSVFVWVACTRPSAQPRRSAARALHASAVPQAGAAEDLVSTLTGLTAHCAAPTEEDRRCIEERQLRHPISAMVAVGKRCKYGFPQALALDPCARRKFGLGGHPIDGALFRLTCPHLVKGIDEWEAEGAVRAFNRRVGEEARLLAAADDANAAHRTIRRALVPAAERESYEGHPVLNVILNSGLAGNNKKGDIKCLHAQLADGLCRGDNAVADAVLEGLQSRGVDPAGGCSCWQQCDLAHAAGPESWAYQPRKNRQKLRATTVRRQTLRSKAASEAAGPAAAASGKAKSAPQGACSASHSSQAEAQPQKAGAAITSIGSKADRHSSTKSSLHSESSGKSGACSTARVTESE